MSKITAMFATRAFARQAEQQLREAGFEEVNIDIQVTPEEIEAASQTTELAFENSLDGASAMPMLAPQVLEIWEANAPAQITVQTLAREEEAIAILNHHVGIIEHEYAQVIQTTKDEVANVLQTPERLR